MGRPKLQIPRKTYIETLKILKSAGISGAKAVDTVPVNLEQIESLNKRIEIILGIFKHFKNKPNRMLYFVMYDIENNKVRNHIAKFLLKKGCTRIQKSIFIADSNREKYSELHEILKEVQAMYENNDSIFFVPVSVDEIRSMKIIGKNVDFSMVVDTPNTMFF